MNSACCAITTAASYGTAPRRALVWCGGELLGLHLEGIRWELIVVAGAAHEDFIGETQLGGGSNPGLDPRLDGTA
jgi:hypothetical protein